MLWFMEVGILLSVNLSVVVYFFWSVLFIFLYMLIMDNFVIGVIFIKIFMIRSVLFNVELFVFVYLF